MIVLLRIAKRTYPEDGHILCPGLLQPRQQISTALRHFGLQTNADPRLMHRLHPNKASVHNKRDSWYALQTNLTSSCKIQPVAKSVRKAATAIPGQNLRGRRDVWKEAPGPNVAGVLAFTSGQAWVDIEHTCLS